MIRLESPPEHSMLDLAQGVREQIIKETKPKAAVPQAFTMRRLRYAALWGACAAGALAVAVLASRGGAGAQRLTAVLHGDWTRSSPVASPAVPAVVTPPFDAQAETRRLAQEISALAASNEELKARLAAVEQDVGDVTGSVSKQIAAADEARRVDDGPTVTATARLISLIPYEMPSVAFAAGPQAAAAPAAADAPAPMAPPVIAYGVDIGSGLTMEALRARWAAIHGAHPQLFEGLEPIVSIREVPVTVRQVPHGTRLELRLVAGPLAGAGAAQHLCASLAPFGLFCQPAMYDGQRLALR